MMRLVQLSSAVVGASLLVACSRSDDDTPRDRADEPETAPASPSAAGAPDQATGMLRPSFGSPECNACMADGCSVELDACTADAACSRLLSCVTDCSNQDNPAACYGGCLLASDSPPAGFDAVFECLTEQCETECSDVQ